MAPTFSPVDAYGVLLVGLIVALLSLLSLAGVCRSRPWVLPSLAGLSLCGAAALAFLAPGPLAFGCVSLAGVLLLGWLLRTDLPGRGVAFVLRSLARPRLQALFLLCVSLTVAFSWPLWLTQQSLPYAEGDLAPDVASREAPSVEPLSLTAKTDQGSPIPLYCVANGPDNDAVADREERLIDRSYRGKVITVGGRGAQSNCHGWVFAGGQFWIVGKDVERILYDNGYEAVKEPAVGDVVVFRHVKGAVPSHTGIVRGFTRDGDALIESKWCHLGCFIHTPRNQPYGEEWEYYRSPRKGHQLVGTDTPSRPDRPTKEQGPAL